MERAKRKQTLLTLTCLLLASTIAQAAPTPKAPDSTAIHPHEDIRLAARQFLKSQIATPKGGKVDIEVGRLDSRLALKPCASTLRTFLPHGGEAHKTSIVGVRCAGPAPWSLYVPVKVALFKPVVVTTRPIGRGVQISSGDITIASRKVNQLSKGYYLDPAQVVGKVAKFFLRSGKTVAPTQLAQPTLVKRGERVTIHAKVGKIHVKAVGKAMKKGGLGDVILIQNLTSRRTVEGRIMAPGEVQVIV